MDLSPEDESRVFRGADEALATNESVVVAVEGMELILVPEKLLDEIGGERVGEEKAKAWSLVRDDGGTVYVWRHREGKNEVYQ